MIVFVIIPLVTEILSQDEKLKLSSSHILKHPFSMMPVSIMQWHAKIGIFNAELVKYLFKSTYQANICPRNLIIPVFFFISDII